MTKIQKELTEAFFAYDAISNLPTHLSKMDEAKLLNYMIQLHVDEIKERGIDSVTKKDVDRVNNLIDQRTNL